MHNLYVPFSSLHQNGKWFLLFHVMENSKDFLFSFFSKAYMTKRAKTNWKKCWVRLWRETRQYFQTYEKMNNKKAIKLLRIYRNVLVVYSSWLFIIAEAICHSETPAGPWTRWVCTQVVQVWGRQSCPLRSSLSSSLSALDLWFLVNYKKKKKKLTGISMHVECWTI